MADIEFVTGEAGENYDFPFTEDLSGYTAGTLTIKDTTLVTTVKTISVTVPSSSLVRWAMTTSNTNIAAGKYVGQLELTGSGLVKKTFLMSVQVHASLT